MRTQPDATAFSVSQNNCHRGDFSVEKMRWVSYCECPQCQALATQEESQAAPVLYLVNQVAAAVEKEFPTRSSRLWRTSEPQAAKANVSAPERGDSAMSVRVLFLAPAGHL